MIPSVLLAMLPNLNLRNLENVLQRSLRTNRAGECIFRASGGTSLKTFLYHANIAMPLLVRCMYRSAQKKTLDTSVN